MPDDKFGVAIKHPWGRGPRSGKRLRATFLKDVRYAEAGGKVYPVLLTSFVGGSFYEEDMSNADEYPADWATRFKSNLKTAEAAIIANDEHGDNNWRFLAIRRVSNVQLSNHLTCEIGTKLTALYFE